MELFFGADVSQCGVPRGDSNSETQLDATLTPCLDELADVVLHRYRHADGARLGIRARQRIVEKCHQPISGEVLDGRLETA